MKHDEQIDRDMLGQTKKLPEIVPEPKRAEEPQGVDESFDFEDFETTDAAVESDGTDEDDVSMYYPGDEAEEEPSRIHTSGKEKKSKRSGSRLTGGQIALIVAAVVLYTAIIAIIVGFATKLFTHKPETSSEIPFDTEPVVTDRPTGDVPPLDDPVTPPSGTEQNPDAPGEPVDKTNPGEEPAKTGEGDSAGTGTDSQSGSGYTPIDGLYNVLVVGIDQEAHLADVTMLVNVNTKDNSITVMQIPRDTLITTGVTTNKINAQFPSLMNVAYHSGVSNATLSALSDYARMLEKSLCVKIHNAVVVSLEGFRGIVDAVGGVDIYVPGPMYYEDPEQDLYISIKEGYTWMDGATAEGFVRFRSGYVQGDLGRVNAQKIFLTALYSKVLQKVKSLDVASITALANQVIKYTTTDMSVADMVFYVRSFANIGMESVTMLTMPGDMENSGNYYVMNRSRTLGVINQHFNIYSKSIENSIFDPKYMFCFTNLQYICDVYFSSAESAYSAEYNADKISQNNIPIPFNN